MDLGDDQLYEYDALDRRISETALPRDYYYSDRWQVIEERNSQSGAATAQYVWSPHYVDELVLRDRDADGNAATGDLGTTGSGLEERVYVQQDANYNVTALTDTTGVVIERYFYDPYGAATVLDANWAADADGVSDVAWVYLHQGGRYDAATGLYHFRNRDYDPTLGQWVQPDPIGYTDGMNRYGYVAGSPTGLVDPFGLTPNRKDARSLDWLLTKARSLQIANPDKHTHEILSLMQQEFSGAPKYVYTTQSGWIDLNHYFSSAQASSNYSGGYVVLAGLAMEFFQFLDGAFVGRTGWGSSAFTSEDLTSNAQGTGLGELIRSYLVWVPNGVPGSDGGERKCYAPSLESLLFDLFKAMGATNPQDAPDWKKLPVSETDHEQRWQEDRARFLEIMANHI